MTEHYGPSGAELSQGDIAFVYLAQTRAHGETPPGPEYDAAGRIPAYPELATFRLPEDREVVASAGFALVVTHSCEIDRQKNRGIPEENWDCRIGVAPIVSQNRAPSLNWDAISRDRTIGLFYLPPAEASSIGDRLPPEEWPPSFADFKAISVASRRQIFAQKLMTLGADRLAVLQLQLVRYFVFREPSNPQEIEDLKGKRIVGVTSMAAKKLAVALVAEDGSTATLRVEL